MESEDARQNMKLKLWVFEVWNLQASELRDSGNARDWKFGTWNLCNFFMYRNPLAAGSWGRPRTSTCRSNTSFLFVPTFSEWFGDPGTSPLDSDQNFEPNPGLDGLFRHIVRGICWGDLTPLETVKHQKKIPPPNNFVFDRPPWTQMVGNSVVKPLGKILGEIPWENPWEVPWEIA